MTKHYPYTVQEFLLEVFIEVPLVLNDLLGHCTQTESESK